jgi:enoyl-CoA hydratase/carnithine racemase
MEYTEIALEVEDRVATITLDRPQQMNAFTNTMMRELLDAFDRTDADDEVRAVVVTGRGRAFCAGADLGGGGATFAKGGSDISEAAVVRDGGGMVALRIFDSVKPVIAAINGAAVGVGITMTLPMDIRLVSDNAKIGFVFARRGIVPEAASSWFLPRLVGIQQAAEWVYTGRLLTAREAVDGRLALRSHTSEDLLPAAYAIAEEIAHNTAPVSIALSRRMLWRMLGEAHPMAAHRVDSRAIAVRGASADAREGVESFLEKREAEFPGKVSAGLPDVFPDWSAPSFS